MGLALHPGKNARRHVFAKPYAICLSLYYPVLEKVLHAKAEELQVIIIA